MGPLHPSLASLPPPLASNPLNPATAHLLSFIFTSGYVGSIYLSKVFSRVEVPPHSRKQGSGASVQREDSGGPSIAIEPVTSTSTSTPSDPLTSAALDAAGPDAAPSTGDDQASDSQSDPDAPKPGERDHPATIRRRMKAVGVATALSLGGVWGVVKVQGGYTFVQAVRPTLTLLGLPTALSPHTSTSSATVTLSYLLAPTLLLGPLYATWLDGDLPSVSLAGSTRDRPVIRWDRFGGGWSLIEWRNYIVGPLTEELVFRSALLASALLAQTPIKTMVYLTPMYFGLAHAHHAWEVYTKGGRTRGAAIRAIAGSLFQLTYTTLFGWFATYSYLRTGSVIPSLVSHAYCNFMGIYLPHIAARRHPRRRAVIWTTYVVGIVGFIVGLGKM